MKWYRTTEYYRTDAWRADRRSGAGVTIQHAFHYIDLLQRAGPPGSEHMGFVECMQLYAAGGAGMVIEPANEDFQRKVRRPLLDRGLLPAGMNLRTAADRLTVERADLETDFLQAVRLLSFGKADDQMISRINHAIFS